MDVIDTGNGTGIDKVTLRGVIHDPEALAVLRQSDPFAGVIAALFSDDPSAAQRAIDGVPESSSNFRRRALQADIRCRAGDVDGARADYRALLDEFAGTAREAVLHQHLGKVEWEAGDFDAARVEFARALTLREASPDTAADQRESSRWALHRAEQEIERRDGFLIRDPRPGEAHTLAALHVECWRQTYSHLLPTDYFNTDRVGQRLPLWERLVVPDQSGRRVLVAEKSGSPIGFAVAGPPAPATDSPARPLQLWSIYLTAAEHGCGAGQALLDAAIGKEPAFLWVAQDNPRARNFYARNGFTPDGAMEVDDLGMTEIRLVR